MDTLKSSRAFLREQVLEFIRVMPISYSDMVKLIFPMKEDASRDEKVQIILNRNILREELDLMISTNVIHMNNARVMYDSDQFFHGWRSMDYENMILTEIKKHDGKMPLSDLYSNLIEILKGRVEEGRVRTRITESMIQLNVRKKMAVTKIIDEQLYIILKWIFEEKTQFNLELKYSDISVSLQHL
jgi:hypothetical protein